MSKPFLIHWNYLKMKSKISELTLNTKAVQRHGVGLVRPECVLADPDGGLWISDARGGISHLDPDGQQRFIAQSMVGKAIENSMPNGLAMDVQGNLVVANMGLQRFEKMTRDGEVEVLFDRVDGEPIGLANFVLMDRNGLIWFTVSSRKPDFMSGFRHDVADGYIGVYDGETVRIVADNLAFPNEIRFDASEQFLYVAETTGKRIRRCKRLAENQLGAPENFGPENLGRGFPDGIAFDVEGNLWLAMVVAEKIVVILPDQSVATVLDAGHQMAIDEVENAFVDGSLERSQMAAAKGDVAPLTSSLAFGGADLKTLFVGNLAGDSIASISVPVPGLPMSHWR
jgi:sugar lactone lactonase YvrE